MENIIINLVEKLNETTERAARAECQVCSLKASLAEAAEYQIETDEKIMNLEKKIADLEDDLKIKVDTIAYQYTKRNELEEKVHELETALKEQAFKVQADGEV